MKIYIQATDTCISELSSSSVMSGTFKQNAPRTSLTSLTRLTAHLSSADLCTFSLCIWTSQELTCKKPDRWKAELYGALTPESIRKKHEILLESQTPKKKKKEGTKTTGEMAPVKEEQQQPGVSHVVERPAAGGIPEVHRIIDYDHDGKTLPMYVSSDDEEVDVVVLPVGEDPEGAEVDDPAEDEDAVCIAPLSSGDEDEGEEAKGVSHVVERPAAEGIPEVHRIIDYDHDGKTLPMYVSSDDEEVDVVVLPVGEDPEGAEEVHRIIDYDHDGKTLPMYVSSDDEEVDVVVLPVGEDPEGAEVDDPAEDEDAVCIAPLSSGDEDEGEEAKGVSHVVERPAAEGIPEVHRIINYDHDGEDPEGTEVDDPAEDEDAVCIAPLSSGDEDEGEEAEGVDNPAWFSDVFRSPGLEDFFSLG
ncbi:uncharacterized protein [Cebidichthys violaceus]|uniref:uncharacterized protein isoform X2 n=1 Tax=Cebidichthys violaceus TaxID=271503 RepID=UPI0035CC11CB